MGYTIFVHLQNVTLIFVIYKIRKGFTMNSPE